MIFKILLFLIIWIAISIWYAFSSWGKNSKNNWWVYPLWAPTLVIAWIFGWTAWLLSKPRKPVVVGGGIESVKGYCAQVRVHGEKNQYYIIDISSESEISVRVRE